MKCCMPVLKDWVNVRGNFLGRIQHCVGPFEVSKGPFKDTGWSKARILKQTILIYLQIFVSYIHT